MAQDIGIALVGCGVVGSAVARILTEDRDALAERTGLNLQLRHVVVRDAARARSVSLPPGVLTDDANRALADPDTRIVVELMGGVTDAEQLTLAAFAADKDVVTANKALLAERGPAIFRAAADSGRCIAFEGAVGGGIPIIEATRHGLVANRIDAVIGILNGTCNYILTRMLANESSYAHALAEAQRLGYAESDPTLDVNGTDSAHKLAILASIAMRRDCPLRQITVRGIESIELCDLRAARELGYVCKLLVIARRRDARVHMSVQPTFIRQGHPLAGVDGPFNAVSLYCSNAGHTLLYGRGAGGAPTASAVVADIVSVANGNAARSFTALAQPSKKPTGSSSPGAETTDEIDAPFYIRIGLPDRPGAIGRIATILGNHAVSLATIVQHEPPEQQSGDDVPVVVMTHPTRESTVRAALAEIEQLDMVGSKAICIPLLEEIDA